MTLVQPRGLRVPDIDQAVRELVAAFPTAEVRVDKTIPAKVPSVVPAASLPPAARTFVTRAGFQGLYAHQLEVFERATRGESLALAAPTAYGKSLAYMLPVAAALTENSEATALYVSPAKALAQQQIARFRALAPDIPMDMYDGDTPKESRGAVRERARLVFTNPDMLHVSLVAYHRGWARFWRNLRYVVLDEAHLYTGAFGSHVALIMRRLRRVAALYGANPVFLLLSATIANPAEHGQTLIGKKVGLVRAPAGWRGERRVLLWQPTGPGGGSVDVFASLLASGLKVLMFGQSRQGVERMHRAAQDTLAAMRRRDLADKVVSYRAGYPAEERRRLEAALFSGQLRGVIATNALELGIDIGDLDAVVLSIPGSVASFWQQAGRAGRGEAPSLVVTVLRDDPVDAYYAQEPGRLLGASVEHATANPGNPVVLSAHLPAAAFERPLQKSALPSWGAKAAEVAERLVESGKLMPAGDGFVSAARSSLAFGVSIRGVGDRWQVVCEDRTVEEIDEPHALLECHPGAIYLSQGTMYAVEALEPETGFVRVRRMAQGRAVYTQARRTIDVSPTGASEVERESRHFGALKVTARVEAFRYVDRDGTPRSDWRKVDQPPFRLETEGLLLDVPSTIRGKPVLQSAVHAAEHLMVNALPVVVTVDRRDVGSTTFAVSGGYRVAFYDLVPGGLGIVRGTLSSFEQWLEVARRLSECSCEAGCPKCVYLGSCTNLDLDKDGGALALSALGA